MENVSADAGTDNLFAPSAKAAACVDKAVRNRLNESFTWLSESYPVLRIDKTALCAWRARPTDFGLYYELASVLHHAPDTARSPENQEKAAQLADSIASASKAAPSSASPVIRNLGTSHYAVSEIASLQSWFDLEPENSMALRPLDDDEFDHSRQQLEKALGVLERTAPEFYGELVALTRDLIFAKPGPTAKMRFGGASSFALWGALALNAKAHTTWWEYLPRLVHEYAHNLLFGLAIDEVLVENDPSERFHSPLRGNERPIDGIFHACYVSAREAIAMDTILAALPEAELGAETETVRSYCTRVSTSSTEAYEDCAQVLFEHARLSPLGKSVLTNTSDFMSERASAG